MLAGRAWQFFLFPFTHIELGDAFSLDQALVRGTLPQVIGNSTKDAFRTLVERYQRPIFVFIGNMCDSSEAEDIALGEQAYAGAYFEEGTYFVPEMLVAARAMKSGLTVLRPFLVEALRVGDAASGLSKFRGRR